MTAQSAAAELMPATLTVAAASPLLEVAGLDGGYGEIQVLRDVNLKVYANEIVAMVGSNGAGKTTLLRMISGLLPPMRGRIAYAGHDITGHASDKIAQLGISQVPEGRRLFRGLTVEENLRLGAYSRRRKTRRDVEESLDAVFASFPRLRERRHQLAGTMSGGEQQMCAIGRALMAKPQMIMIDELSLGLAPVIVEELVQILRDIRERGTTILLVEQDVSVALGVSERAIVLRTGQVAMEGPSRDLLSDEEIVRTYLGG